jgi:hypothetical protein
VEVRLMGTEGLREDHSEYGFEEVQLASVF